MGIEIKGNNNGIAVEGNVTIGELNLEFGKGITSAKSVNVQEVEEAKIVEEKKVGEFIVQKENESTVGLNHDSTREALKEFLTEDWLEELRSDERYTVGWMNAFVDALISSPHGEKIVRDWSVEGREKKNEIMGYVLGLLKENGVLKGSYDAISRRVNLMENYRSFAKHIGEGKKQLYALWVKAYVDSHGR